MPTFEPFDVVAVPFPYVEREARKHRPTVTVSDPGLTDRHGLLWVVMVTSAAHRPWAEDVAIDDLAVAGLSKPPVIRVCEIAAAEAARCERRIGRPPAAAAGKVAACLRRTLAAAVA